MKVLVIASGGDTPGMNRVIFNLYKKFKDNLFACKRGFSGLIDGEIYPASVFEPKKYKNEAGVCIKSARCPRFITDEGFKKGLKNAKKFDAVVILGGNGSAKGAKRLAENGVKTIFAPATIDNDIEGSEYSLGFHTAVKACCDAVYNVMPSMNAFDRTCVFQVMGRRCDKIAKNVANAVGADALVASEEELNFQKIAKILNKNFKQETSSIIILRENILPVEKFISNLKTMTKGVEIKPFVVGHLQRGTKPSKVDIKKANQISKNILKAIKSNQKFAFTYFEEGCCKIK